MIMDNRTIQRAIQKRVPEIYFRFPPQRSGDTVLWKFYANINSRPHTLYATMPFTALVSHRELLNTMVSELYDEVKNIKRGAVAFEIDPGEDPFPPLSDKALRTMGYLMVEDKISDTGVMPDIGSGLV